MIISIWLLVISFIKSSIHSYNTQSNLYKKQKNQINLLSEFENDILEEYINLRYFLYNSIEINNNTKYYFIINNYRYYYDYKYVILESIKNFPFYDQYDRNLGEIYITDSEETIHINPQNFTEKVYVKFESYSKLNIPILKYINNNQDNIYGFFAKGGNYNRWLNFSEIITFRNNEDYVFYININIGKVEVWFSQNIKGISFDNIININKTYFKQLNDNILNLEKDNFYIFILKDKTNYTSGEYSILPINIENILIKYKSQNIVYLKENKIYNITFQDNSIKRLIKLAESTLNSIIKVTIDNKEIKVNKQNPYFEIGYIKSILLKAENSNGIIEFLYDYSKIPQINIRYYHNLFNNSLIIKCENLVKNSGKVKLIFLNSTGLSNLHIISGYSKLPYMSYDAAIERSDFLPAKKIQFELNIPQKELLVENETFNILISYNLNSSSSYGIEIYLDYQSENLNKNSYGLIVLLIIIIYFISFLIFFY